MPNSQRLSSITTRIKTAQNKMLDANKVVRDYLPLQQGLRLSFFEKSFEFIAVRDYLPLQQGLRPDHGTSTM